MSRWILTPMILLTLGSGCDDDPGRRPPHRVADDCVTLQLGERDFQFNAFATLTGLRYGVSPGLDGPAPEALIVELYDSTTPDLPPLVPGTFDLGTAPNDDLATCQHCVWLPVDSRGQPPFGTVFVATSGTLELTRITDPLFYDPVFAGRTSEIVLREATMDEYGHTSLVSGGRCLRAPPASFDTAPTPGDSCLSAEDCGNALLEVCSPTDYTCTAPECGDFLWCPEERPMCLGQYQNVYQGACYAVCDPTVGGDCGNAEVCVQLSVDPTLGVCERVGEGQLGDACAVEDASTSCVSGTVCSVTTRTCTRTCSFFADEPGCQEGTQCNVLGICEPGQSAIDVPIGADCGQAATFAQGCAPNGAAFRGICFAYLPEDPQTCLAACFDDLGCGSGEFCALRFTSGLGVCQPNPQCGDGLLGEIGEVCDDGNVVSNDGCSSDCQTVEYGVICGAAASLVGDGTTPGDTSSAWDGFFATCQAGLARTEAYRFVPPSRGRLRLTIDSPTLQVVSLRTTCDDAESELQCRDSAGAGPFSEIVHQIIDPAQELTVLVSAFTVLEEGPYVVNTEFVAESCGDGVGAGLEVCDDGNTESNDGCSGDCRAVEYDVYCAEATELTVGNPMTGDNDSAPQIYHGSCSNDAFGSGRDRLYRVTAPAAGTLRLQLEQGDANLSLAVYDGCGEPNAMVELGCSSVYGVEEVNVQVTPGQTFTVLVEGFGPGDAGPFTLTADMP